MDDRPQAARRLAAVADNGQSPAERRRAEEASRESEERYRTMVELSPTAIMVTRDFRILYANSAAAELLGAETPEELIGRRSLDFVHPGDHAKVRERRDKADRHGMGLPPLEVRHLRLDGTLVYGDAAAAGINWEGERALLLAIRDIDAIKHSERALAESEQRFRDFAESTADRFWETDTQHRFTYFTTPNGQRIYNDENILGKTRRELSGHMVDPDSVEMLHRYMDARQPFKDHPQRIRGPDGKINYRRVSGLPVFGPDGEFRGYRGTTVDETAERMAHERVSDIQRQFIDALEVISEGFAMWGPDNQFIYCNSHFRDNHREAAECLEPGHGYADFIAKLANSGTRPEAVGREDEWIKTRVNEMLDGIHHQEPAGEGWIEVRKERLPDGSTIVVFNDITEAKEREVALQESEQRFRDFARTASSRLWETDDRHRFVMALTGEGDYLTSMEDMIGRTRWERVGADPDPRLWIRHRQVVESHQPFRDFQYRQTDRHGRVRFLRANGTPFYGEDGVFKGYRGTTFDVTAEVVAERALRESEKRLRQITDSIPAFIAYLDTDLRYRFANRYYRKTGLAPEAVIGRGIAEVIGREAFERNRPHYERVLAGEPVEFENRIEGEDGLVVTHVHLTPEIGAAGVVEGVFIMAIDITERKQWEEALKRSKESLDSAQRMARIGSWECNFEGTDLIWSDELYRIFGLDPAGDKITFDTLLSMLQPEDRPRLIAEINEAARDRVSGFSNDYHIVRPDGTERIIRSAGQIIYDEAGRPLKAAGTAQDVTERVRAEEALDISRREAELANRAKSEFLSSMSHELRTPMNAILGYAQLLLQNKKQQLSELQTRQVNQILRGGQHLLRLINDILDLAKIESGRLALSLEDVDPRRVIDECIELLNTLSEARDIEVLDTTTETALPWIRADQTRFRQALLNLMSNAIKYNRRDGKVTISAEEAVPGMLRVIVEDTGPGIPAVRQRELFEPFSRLGAEERGIEGTGIGLLITKQLVELMDGAIDYSSEMGVGSKFWLDLPCITEETRAARGQRLSLKMAPSEGNPDAAPRTVLYVEDDVPNLQLMEEVVSQLPNVRLLSASSAEKGIQLACEKTPDLVIFDVNLPGMSGLEAVGELRRRTGSPDLPVIALTAAARLEDIRRGQIAGFDRYLTKPVRVADLLMILYKFLYPDDG